MIPLGILAASVDVSEPPASELPIEFLGYYSDASDATEYTFTDVPLGLPAANRTILVVAHANVGSGRYIFSTTIGGVSAAYDVRDTKNTPTAFYRAVVPTGETGTIVVTISGCCPSGAGIGVYRTTQTLTKIASATGDTSVSIENLSGDFVIAAMSSAVASSTTVSGVEPLYNQTLADGLTAIGGWTDAVGTLAPAMSTNGWTKTMAAVSYRLS